VTFEPKEDFSMRTRTALAALALVTGAAALWTSRAPIQEVKSIDHDLRDFHIGRQLVNVVDEKHGHRMVAMA
jgi:hypothetical protein